MVSLNPYRQNQIIVIKIGSALLVDPEAGKLRANWLKGLCQDVSLLRQSGLSVILVSSGAIALGRTRLNLWGRKLSLAEKQACAATGQSILTRAYEDALSPFDLTTAQILLTLNDTENRRRWLNARNTIGTLLELGIVPIINENDTVATDEIRYGDNDRLAARTAQMLSADTLILLSDIDGLYSRDPRAYDEAKHIPEVLDITHDITEMAGASNAEAGVGSGGMATKIAAARISTQAGCDMCIMDGRDPNPIKRLQNGAKSSWFKAVLNPKDARRQWIGGHLNAKGRLTIDDGAKRALRDGKSLLAVGVTEVSGEFEKGDTVRVFSTSETELARGIIAYSAKDTQKILGKSTQEIAEILNYDYGMPLIHRDNLVMVDRVK